MRAIESLILILVVAIALGWVVSLDKQGREEREEREQACQEEVSPYQSKLIDGVCHYRTEDGWKESVESEE